MVISFCGHRDFIPDAKKEKTIIDILLKYAETEQEVYKADEDEQEVVEQMMNKMQLDDYQCKVLTHRMAGLSMGEIGRLLNRSVGAIGSVIDTIQRRYTKYIQA